MRLILSLALLLFVASPAAAYCPSVPDDGTTGYVTNNTAKAVCLQRELALDTSLAAERARIEAELNQLQQDLRQQQLQMQQPYFVPTWPQL
jgi:AmiR/NasT family two-component response regulator